MIKHLKKYFYIIFSIFIAAIIIITLREDRNKKLHETCVSVNELSNQSDSLFNLADEVLEVVSKEKEMNDSVVNSLDDKVKNKEITIEEQIKELKRLVKQSNDARLFAIEQSELATEMERQSILQKQLAEEARLQSEIKYKKLLEENFKLQETIDILNKKIEDLANLLNKKADIIVDIESDTIPSFDNVDDKKKKKKRN